MNEDKLKVQEDLITTTKAKFDRHVELMCKHEPLRRPILKKKHPFARRLLIKVATQFRTDVDNPDLDRVNIEYNEERDELRVTLLPFKMYNSDRNPVILFEGKKSDLMDWADHSYQAYNCSKSLLRLGVQVHTP